MSEFINHSHNHKAPFFEGWYYKLVNATKDQCVIVIPGMSCPEDKEGKCFIQVGRWPDVASAKCIDYPLTTLWPQDDGKEICIGSSCFSPTKMSIDIKDGDKTVTGHIELTNSKTLKKNVMGPFGHMPMLQCGHGIISMDSDLSGQLIIDNQTIDFAGGKGYIEKNWGKEFPKKHLWIQSNHFDKDIKSLTCAVADVPTPMGSMLGFFCILVGQNDKEYRFATYNGAKLSVVSVDGCDIYLEITSGGKRLRITADGKDAVQLDAPKDGDMVRKLIENLGSNVIVELVDIKTGNIIASGTGEMAGVEAEGMSQ